MSGTRRILVLGSAPHAGVDCFKWDDIPPNISLADYETIIINLVRDEETSGSVSGGRPLPSARQFARQLFSQDSEIFVIGNPTTNLASRSGQYAYGTWWVPLAPEIHLESGSVFEVVDSKFDYYFRHVSEWSFFWSEPFQANLDPAEYARIVQPKATGLVPVIDPIAETRFGGLLAFRIFFVLTRDGGGEAIESGSIYWFPAANKLTSLENVNLVLREEYGILAESPIPEWALNYSLPKEELVSEEIVTLEAERTRIEAGLESAQRRLELESRFRALLYERGEVLERVVRDALATLGAEVEVRPRDREDGRIRVPLQPVGIIEIKSHKSAVSIRDIRQVQHWVSDAIADENLECKGILIANAFVDTPLYERTRACEENAARVASRFEVAILTTSQLFFAIRQQQRGELDVEEFWSIVMGSNGLCGIPDPVSHNT
jgi:hypothetical protein